MNFQIELIHEIGQRENNEDALLVDKKRNFLMVCDGVGGSDKGEKASRLAVNSFSYFLRQKENIDKEILKEALRYTEIEFDNYIEKNPDCQGMATTLTFVYFFEKKAIVAHCGDSRVYQVRNNTILFKTKDHSLVQELVEGGYITAEAAKEHPKKNQITRAIRGTENHTSLEISVLDDVQLDDYFMLCTDGILESIDDEFIKHNFASNLSLPALRDKILFTCKYKSKDNFTAVLVKISNEQNPAKPIQLVSEQSFLETLRKKFYQKGVVEKVVLALIIIVLIVIVFLAWQNFKS